MAVTMEQIRAAVLASPELRLACEAGNDQLIADTVQIAVPNFEKLTAERLRKNFGLQRSSEIIFAAKLKANGINTAEQYKMSLLISILFDDGIDLWSDDANSVIAFLLDQEVITAPEVSQVQSLKTKNIKPTIFEVGLALAPWRADGKIGPIPENATA